MTTKQVLPACFMLAPLKKGKIQKISLFKGTPVNSLHGGNPAKSIRVEFGETLCCIVPFSTHKFLFGNFYFSMQGNKTEIQMFIHLSYSLALKNKSLQTKICVWKRGLSKSCMIDIPCKSSPALKSRIQILLMASLSNHKAPLALRHYSKYINVPVNVE